MTSESDQNQNETFLKLLAQSEVVLRAYLRSVINDQNHLSEVLQNTFIVGWKKYDQFTGNQGEFTKWLCIIGKYEALKHRQNLARDRLNLNEKLVQQIANEGESDISSYSLWIGKLKECIMKLSNRVKKMNTLSGLSNHLCFIKSKNDLTSLLTLLSHPKMHTYFLIFEKTKLL